MTDSDKTIDGFAYWIENEENGVCYIPLNLCEKIMKLLKEQPEIVECKDCSYYDMVECKDCKYGYMLPNSSDYVYCTKPYSGTTSHKPKWFCADGERRDGDG